VLQLVQEGRRVNVTGPDEQWDLWQLWVDGCVMASGFRYGTFEKNIVRYYDARLR
jgi:hypothetical protein